MSSFADEVASKRSPLEPYDFSSLAGVDLAEWCGLKLTLGPSWSRFSGDTDPSFFVYDVSFVLLPKLRGSVLIDSTVDGEIGTWAGMVL